MSGPFGAARRSVSPAERDAHAALDMRWPRPSRPRMTRYHARPRSQVRLEAVAKAALVVLLLACIFVAITAEDPEILSRGLG